MLKRSGILSKAVPSASMPQPSAIIGHSQSIHHLLSLIDVVSDYTCTVLVHGETGTGKELVARHIHARSKRSSGPFVTVDCTTLRDTLFESQLFGHIKGAFTGAEQDTIGFFRAAEGGTLFLDEIGELDLPVQAKLLRCLQDSAVIPLGGIAPIPVDVRLIAATHRNIKSMVQKGTFREDLYFRLNVITLKVPPLRDRREDIPELAATLLDEFAEVYGKGKKSIAPEAMRVLREYAWPGNVRELANAMEHAFVLAAAGVVTEKELPEEILAVKPEPAPDASHLVIPLEEAERQLISRAMVQAQGNLNQAAKMLGIDRHRLYRKIERYQLK